MKYIALVIATIALSSCGFTQFGDDAKLFLKTNAAKAMDVALMEAEFVICDGASAGAVQRRYGQSEAKADARRTLCHKDGIKDAVVFVSE